MSLILYDFLDTSLDDFTFYIIIIIIIIIIRDPSLFMIATTHIPPPLHM